MALSAGARIGPYEVLSPLGAGGMGEVYRARDTKLDRDVAIKVLPESLAADPDRLARLKREARVLAAVNHPNIAHIHGFEDSTGVAALVMELVEGPTLADRLARGPIPLAEALPIAQQIAEALEAAHEQAIVHRDLKPANIKVRDDGTVKVLDFGLAKALDPTPGSSPHVTNSPTLSLQATQAGIILGTAAYMSPEQARGKTADRRADIWAFGVVLFEMLTGRRAFEGDDLSITLAAVMMKEPDWSALPASTPATVRRLLGRCLEKDPRRRLQSIGEARIQIEDVRSGRSPDPAGVPFRPSAALRLVTLVAVLAIATAVGLAVLHFGEAPLDAPSIRFQVLPPAKATMADYPTISPDGHRLAFVATVDGKTLLWVQPLDSLSAQPLAGTDDATAPFWSPDGRALAFFSSGKLRRVDVAGGPPQKLADAAGTARGGTWGGDGTILFASGSGPIRRVLAGGASVPVTTLDAGTEVSHNWPQFLPDGRHFLYWVAARSPDAENNAVVIGSLDDKPDSLERRRLLAGASMAAYAADHLLFEREGILMAQAFDAGRLQFRGDPVPLVQRVGQVVVRYGWRAFSVSLNGTLAYATFSGAQTQLAWFDRAGTELGRLGQPEDQLAPRLSPDQKRVAVAQRDAQGRLDIWLFELARDLRTRLTFQPAINSVPIWSPDGLRVVFNSNRSGTWDLYGKASSGAGGEDPLLTSRYSKIPTDWSADGRFILYQTSQNPNTGWDLWVLPLEDGGRAGTPAPLLQTGFNEVHGQFSPDGHWIAYQSDESRQYEVYVQAFPDSHGKFQISITGGTRPRWRHDGNELFYLSPDGKMMAVEVKATASTFEASRPRELFQTHVASEPFVAPTYDVSADGQRFLIQSALDDAKGLPPMTIVMNWAQKK